MRKKILYVQYTNPACYPSLEHSSHILAERDWKILFCGTGAFGADSLRFTEHSNVVVRQLTFCQGGWFQKMHYFWFCLWVIGWVMLWRPRWIYASNPLSCPIGLLIGCILRFKIIYHEHDSPSPNNNLTYFMHFVLWDRCKLSHRAQLCVLPNEIRSAKFIKETETKRPVITVWNCPRLEEVISEPRVGIGAHLCVIYAGSIGPDRLQTTIFKAISTLPSAVSLWVIGYETVGSKGYIKQLQGLSRALGIYDRVKFLGEMSRSEMLLYSKKADIGLCLIPRNSNDINFKYMIGASVKPFEYLACGLALLVSDLPDWQKMYVEPGYGLACNPEDPESIAASLKWFLEHPAEMRQMGERGRQRILTEWNYERQFEPVLNLTKGSL